MTGRDPAVAAPAAFSDGVFAGVGMLGVRIALGAIFIVHAFPKFEPWFSGFLEEQGFPAWIQYPIAVGELVPGIMLVAGVLSRMSGAVIAAIMLGVFITIDGFMALTGDKGMEYHLILFAAAILVMVMGPGRLSASSALSRLPRWLH